MIIENFSKKMLDSRIFNTYVATAFFSSLIFYVLHSSLFTPIEMIFGIVIATIIFKGVANMMLSLTISLVSLDNVEDQVAFKKDSDTLDSLVNDMAIQEAAIQSNKSNKKK